MSKSERAAQLTVAEIASRWGAEVVGHGDFLISGVAPLDTASVNQLSFLSNPLYLSQACLSQAGAVIIAPAALAKLQAEVHGASERTWVVANNPYACFARVALWFATHAAPCYPEGVAGTARVAADVVVPTSCHIGPGVIIESGVVLGERVRILGNTYVGQGVQIGDDSLIYANVSIYHQCVLGERCIVHSGAVIGADGFGFAPDFGPQGGEWIKIPQTGRTVIGNDVEIGANTTIDRGAMADTVIEQGCKLDNQIQIAHNVRVGAYTVIAGCAAIAGSTKVGRYCIIGGSANLAGHLTIADKVTISGGTSITKSISTSGHFTSVFPFMVHGEWEKNAAILRGLGKMRDRIRQLEAKFKTLQAK